MANQRVVDPVSSLLLVAYDTHYGEKVALILGINLLRPLMKTAEKIHGA